MSERIDLLVHGGDVLPFPLMTSGFPAWFNPLNPIMGERSDVSVHREARHGSHR
ncbi:hypothetical protein GCM10022206_10480 [Streptomyces chiangmaiensis]